MATALQPRLVRRSCLPIVLLALLAWVPAAFGHANLEGSTPPDAAVLATAPSEVELRFTEGVTADQPGSVKIFGPDERIEDGQATTSGDGLVVTQRLMETTTGTHAVAWRLTSLDGHPITGSITFHVGERSGGTKVQDAGREAAAVGRGMSIAFGISRFFVVLFLLVAVGGGLFACLFAPTAPARFLVGALVLLILSLAVSLALNSAIVHDTSLAEAVAPPRLNDAIRNPFGSAALVTAALAVLSMAPAALLRSGSQRLVGASRVALALVFCGLAASLSLAGHATVTEPVPLRLSMDVVHVIAAAIWIGGLVQLYALAPAAGQHIHEIKRFSNAAFGSVLVLLATGAVATVLEVSADPRDLVDTQYGRIILGKLLLYAGTMPLAWMNKSLYLPTIERRPEHATHLLRQYVYRELFLVVTVVALTAWLIGTNPGS